MTSNPADFGLGELNILSIENKRLPFTFECPKPPKYVTGESFSQLGFSANLFFTGYDGLTTSGWVNGTYYGGNGNSSASPCHIQWEYNAITHQMTVSKYNNSYAYSAQITVLY